METKVCIKCREEKPLDQFYRRKSSGGGYINTCKACHSIMNREWRESHVEERREYKRIYYSSPKGTYLMLCYRATQKGFEVGMTLGEFLMWLEEQPPYCHYCDIALKPNKQYPDGKVIERKDNNRNYSLDNIVLSCWRCNTIKSNIFTYEEMYEIADKYIIPKIRRREI